MKTIRAFIVRIAQLTARTPEARAAQESRRWYVASTAAFIFCLILAAVEFGPVLKARWIAINSAPIQMPFSNSRWKYLDPNSVKNADILCNSPIVGAGCPASLQNPLAAKVKAVKADKDHRALVMRAGSKPFWLIYDVTADEARIAAREMANQVFIGLIGGDYKIFIDGILMREGNPEAGRSVVSVSVPFSWLNAKMRIAVRIKNKGGSAIPDVFESSYLRSTGLITPASLDALTSLRNFVDENRHWMLWCIYFGASLFFFFLWRATPGKRELFYFGVYGLVMSFLSMRLAVSYYLGVTRTHWYEVELVLRVCEAMSGLAVGLAVARIEKWVLWFALSFLGPLIFVGLFGHLSGPAILSTSSWIGRWIVPNAYLVAAILCGIQAAAVASRIAATRNHALRLRVRRLLQFGATFLSIGALYHIQAAYIASPGTLVSAYRYAPLLGFLISGAILFREFRDQSKQIDHTPISKYHRMNPVPVSVQGYVLEIDLKGSEPLYRLASETLDQNLLVQPFVDAWIVIAQAAGGELLEHQGDMIRIFFESSDSSSAERLERGRNAVQASIDMSRIMDRIAFETTRRTGINFVSAHGVPAFRASISFGAIRPVFLGTKNHQVAAWVNGDQSQVLLRTSRLQLAEKYWLKSNPSRVGQATTTLTLDEDFVPAEVIAFARDSIASKGAAYQCQKLRLDEKSGESPPFALLVLTEETSDQRLLDLAA